ncbi:competence protein ComEC [Granulicella pectinivorans]|uniref:Competence protein ComEC n=1 Tax=Granulicella pectinivorans TaxID=474950 RepID=A0A1I6LTC8_9BACT|nr:ComEC/Rec2 family competence protein [Granulicella pectinivorans]SFS06666.1 competence protein ComEC [Granulicella pectinivorans]
MRRAEPKAELWPARGVERLAFRRLPVLWAAGWFCAGVGMARFSSQPVAVWIIALVLLGGLLAVRVQTAWVRLVPLAGLWVVVGFACAATQPAPSQQRELRAFADNVSREVRGEVVRVRRLEAEEGEADGVSIDVAVEAVEEDTPETIRMVPVTGGARLTVVGGAPALRCGDWVDAPVRMRVPEQYRDPGAWQYGDALLEQGIGAHGTVRGEKLAPVGGRSGGWRCRLYAAQSWASGRMREYAGSAANLRLPRAMRMDAADAGMIDAMLFGDRAGLRHELRLGFERTGSFHLFVVSGMHVALIAFGLFWLARRVRMPEWAATCSTIALTAAYAMLTGFGVPVQRALWMSSLFLVARLLDRERNSLNALGVAVLVVLVWSPSALFEASFEMTFLAIVAVAGIAGPLGERSFLPYARAARRLGEVWLDVRYEPKLAQFRVMLRLAGEPVARIFGRWAGGWAAALVRMMLWGAELGLVAVVVEAVMAAPMAVYFHRAVALGLPANVVSVPVIALLMPLALATFLASLVSAWLAMVPGAATGLLLHGVTWFIGHVSRSRLGDVRVAEPIWWVLAGALAGVAFCCWAARRPGWGWAAVAMLPVVVALVIWPERPVSAPGMLEVTALDVGQGDSLLVTGPGGASMLVDAGGPVGGLGPVLAMRATGFDVGEEVVAPYLWSRRIRRLDVVALTHEHSDHMGGMPAVLRDFRPRELWVGLDVPSSAYAALLTEAASLGVRVRRMRAGDRVDWDGVAVSVLSPAVGYGNGGPPKNDDSLVMRMQFGKASVLLEGDAERKSEAAMVAAGAGGPVTLLKVGHHGSATSSTEEFLAATAPREAVISVGRENTFGHPRGDVVARFAARGTRLYRTDMFGLTTFLLDREGGLRVADTGKVPGFDLYR